MLAQCKYVLFNIFNMLIKVYIQYMILTNGWHNEHVKAKTWSGEEEEHGQSEGGLSQFSDPEK